MTATVEPTQFRLESERNSCDVRHESRGWIIVQAGRYISRSNAPFDTKDEAIELAKEWLGLQDAAQHHRIKAADYERQASALFDGAQP